VRKGGWCRAVGGELADGRGDIDWLGDWLGDSARAVSDGESGSLSHGVGLGTLGDGGWGRAVGGDNVRSDGGVGSGIIRPAVGHGEQRKGWEERQEGLHLDE